MSVQIPATEVSALDLTQEQSLQTLKLRQRNLRRSILALVFLPSVATASYWICYAMYWQIPVIAPLLLQVTYVLSGVLAGASAAQVFAWWSWRGERTDLWKIGLLLVLAWLIGQYLSGMVQMLTGEISFLSASLFSIGYHFFGMVAHGFVFVAINSIVAFRLVDSLETRNHPDRLMQGPAPESSTDPLEAVSGRQPFSIAMLMSATLAAALALLMFKWMRTTYSQSGSADGYPLSDMTYAVWMLTSACNNVLCLIAVSVWRVKRSYLVAMGIMTLALFTSLVGRIAWAASTPDGGMEFFFDSLPALLLDAFGMVLLHQYLFRRWEGAGYQLITGRSKEI